MPIDVEEAPGPQGQRAAFFANVDRDNGGVRHEEAEACEQRGPHDVLAETRVVASLGHDAREHRLEEHEREDHREQRVHLLARAGRVDDRRERDRDDDEQRDDEVCEIERGDVDGFDGDCHRCVISQLQLPIPFALLSSVTGE